jgi:hypothetical protein
MCLGADFTRTSRARSAGFTPRPAIPDWREDTMKHAHATLSLIVFITLTASGCAATVFETRLVPIYETRAVEIGTRPAMIASTEGVVSAALTPIYEERRVQVGTRVERREVTKRSWKRTAVGGTMVPLTVLAYLLAGLG